MTRYLILSAVPALMATLAVAGGEDDEKTAKICAEAEERYVELFGKPSAEEEGVTVVTMYKYNFCPGEITVPVGTTVRWVNVDKRTSHSVIVKGEPESDRAFGGTHRGWSVIVVIVPAVGAVTSTCGKTTRDTNATRIQGHGRSA